MKNVVEVIQSEFVHVTIDANLDIRTQIARVSAIKKQLAAHVSSNAFQANTHVRTHSFVATDASNAFKYQTLAATSLNL